MHMHHLLTPIQRQKPGAKITDTLAFLASSCPAHRTLKTKEDSQQPYRQTPREARVAYLFGVTTRFGNATTDTHYEAALESPKC